jgi:RNA polymerase sigma-70 factor, ECF subfamily
MGTVSGAGRVVEAGREADDEVPLVERARSGDAEAFRQLVDRHRDRAYGLALRIVRSAVDAEDVAQEAFVRAWLALPRFRGESSFTTWLHRIVVRRAFDRFEQMKRRRGREIDLDAVAEQAVSGGGDPSATLRSRRLELLIATLGPMQRAAVTLFYYEDRSVEEVAHTLGVPENTVKTHLSRARAALREGWMRVERGTNQ